MPDEPRLRAGLWVSAYLRRCAGQSVPAYLIRRGDASAGAVLIKLNFVDGRTAVLSRARRGDGSPVWLRATGAEPVADAEAEAYVNRQLERDPDLWVLEVEDREGRHLLDEPVE